MSSIRGPGARLPQADIDADIDACPTGRTTQATGAAATEPMRTTPRWFDFKDLKKVENIRFLRDGGTATFEGTSLGQDLAFRYDGAIRSPTRGQVFVRAQDGRGTERPLNPSERGALAKQVEGLAAKARGANAEPLRLLSDRLKSSATGGAGGTGPVAPPTVKVPEAVRNAVFEADAGRFRNLGNMPDRQYVAVDGAKKLAGGGFEVTLATYRTSIAGPIPGHQGKVEGSERTYRYDKNGTVDLVKPPAIGGAGTGTAGAVKLESLTTDRMVNMKVEGSEVRIGAGFGGPIRAQGGKVGLEVDGKKFEVTTKRGDQVKPKLDELRKSIEAAGYRVTETSLPTIDTLALNWKVEKASTTGTGGTGGTTGTGKKEKTGAELARDVERMLKGKVTEREAKKLREIATSVPIVMGHLNPRDPGGYAPAHVRERAKSFGDMIVTLRGDKKLYDFLMSVAEMQLERHPPIPAGPTIDHMRDVLGRYGQSDALKAFDASLSLPDDWNRNQR